MTASASQMPSIRAVSRTLSRLYKQSYRLTPDVHDRIVRWLLLEDHRRRVAAASQPAAGAAESRFGPTVQ
jgi:hypothetical protein